MYTRVRMLHGQTAKCLFHGIVVHPQDTRLEVRDYSWCCYTFPVWFWVTFCSSVFQVLLRHLSHWDLRADAWVTENFNLYHSSQNSLLSYSIFSCQDSLWNLTGSFPSEWVNAACCGKAPTEVNSSQIFRSGHWFLGAAPLRVPNFRHLGPESTQRPFT